MYRFPSIVNVDVDVIEFEYADLCLITSVTFLYLTIPQVSVDIRSPMAGVLVEACAKAGETVQVGATLFKVDTDGKAAPAAAPVVVAASTPASAPVVASSPSSSSSSSSHCHHRVPMIKFKFGKRRTFELQ